MIPQEGCLECDSCTDALIFTVEDLNDLLRSETLDFKVWFKLNLYIVSKSIIFFNDPNLLSFKDKADTFFTTQRLNYISNQTELLKPRITELKNVDLGEVTSAVKGLETNGKNLLRSVKSVEKKIYIHIIHI